MYFMGGLQRPKARAVVWLVVFSTFAVSCSRPAGLRPDSPTQADQRQVPFQDTSSTPGNTAAGVSSPGQNKGQKGDAALPFRNTQDLPAGTLLTVRLKSPVSSENPGRSLTFDAVVDEPVRVEGNTLLPRGTSVAGRVESARTSQMKRNRGYIRLTLDAIDFDGRQLPVQTSSLFVHGNTQQMTPSDGADSPQVIHLESGRRLTFRLIEPVSIAGSPLPSH
jgi:hypothetical protein